MQTTWTNDSEISAGQAQCCKDQTELTWVSLQFFRFDMEKASPALVYEHDDDTDSEQYCDHAKSLEFVQRENEEIIQQRMQVFT